MFAVEGWKLAGVVAQTNVSKKKLKRKRDEANDPAAKKDDAKAKEQRVNPFALGNAQSTKGTVGSKPQKMIQSAEDSKATKDETVATAPTISDRQKARNRAKKRAQRKIVNASTTEDSLPIEPTVSKQIPKISPSATSIPTLTPLQQKMRAKLSGSQFRQINEKLYTTHSSEALSLFTDQPSLFHDYHQGFRHQVQSWPTNPIQVFISLLSSLHKKTKHAFLVADLGCGDAALANHFKNTKGIKIRSFDLVKVNEFVEVCDTANVPLQDESVDVAVFCLSLMGTNFLNFITEACRYTKLNGQIWIAEIKSRFVDSSFQSFVERLKVMGLKLVEMDKENKMFVIMRFEKISREGSEGSGGGVEEGKLLKACLYKKR